MSQAFLEKAYEAGIERRYDESVKNYEKNRALNLNREHFDTRAKAKRFEAYNKQIEAEYALLKSLGKAEPIDKRVTDLYKC